MGNTINGTYYNLIPGNDYIATPVVGKFVILYGFASGSSSGHIQSTNVAFTSDTIVFSGMTGANYPRNSGDSGGLICSDKNGYNYNTMGIHKGYFNGYSVFTSAKNAVNLWYLTRY